MENQYCHSLTQFSRQKTIEVKIGNTFLGGKHPIKIQSMTNTNTLDTEATVNQCIKIFDAGADFVRITTPNVNDAENLKNIKSALKEKGYNQPLIADIHFNPLVAEKAAEFVEKIRINPGNFVDKKKLENISFSDSEYIEEIEKIKVKLIPLLEKCKKYNTAIRIGTNHGSLSDRIVSKYGDTAEGMVEATLEFLRICKQCNFNHVVISLKSSNTKIMVQACRLLINKMQAEQMNYPLHLGVTEAGEGEDGRIKSATGIGTLLMDGIGDTIRVSLTEDPELEIPVAKFIVDYIQSKENHLSIEPITHLPYNPFEYNRRKTNQVKQIGGNCSPVVIADLRNIHEITPEILNEIGFITKPNGNDYIKKDIAPDFILIDQAIIKCKIPECLGIICKKNIADETNYYPLYSFNESNSSNGFSKNIHFIELTIFDLAEKNIEYLKQKDNLVIILKSKNTNSFAEQRAAIIKLWNHSCNHPVIVACNYSTSNIEHLQLMSSCDLGVFFIDGLADGILLSNSGNISKYHIVQTAFGILQATGVRISKTEYISCPSCGRTHFDLQKATTKIRAATSHLKGLKIGIMGCIVNGPGEMADADYGYVGTGFGKITLYKKKEIVKKSIPEENAVEELIQLIKKSGDWNENINFEIS